jgi:hypothetical protein
MRVAAPMAETIETGVEMTNAHGHAMTNSTSARYTQVLESLVNTHPASAINPAKTTTAGV